MESEISKFLSRDHKRIDDLFNEFQKGKLERDFVKAQGYFKRFKCNLLCHMAMEENILFSFYEGKSGNKKMGTTMTMRQEHKKLRKMIDLIHDRIRKDDFETYEEEEKLFSLLESHSFREESTLHLAIDIVTDEEEKKKLFLKLRNYSQECCNACSGD